jgi:hypothetical protein
MESLALEVGGDGINRVRLAGERQRVLLATERSRTLGCLHTAPEDMQRRGCCSDRDCCQRRLACHERVSSGSLTRRPQERLTL